MANTDGKNELIRTLREGIEWVQQAETAQELIDCLSDIKDNMDTDEKIIVKEAKRSGLDRKIYHTEEYWYGY